MYPDERYSMHWGWWVLLLVVVAVGSTWKYFFDIYSIDKAGSEEIAQVLSLYLQTLSCAQLSNLPCCYSLFLFGYLEACHRRMLIYELRFCLFTGQNFLLFLLSVYYHCVCTVGSWRNRQTMFF
jgi:hypothetical protein